MSANMDKQTEMKAKCFVLHMRYLTKAFELACWAYHVLRNIWLTHSAASESDLDVRVVIELELVLGLCELKGLDGPGLYPCQRFLHLHAWQPNLKHGTPWARAFSKESSEEILFWNSNFYCGIRIPSKVA